MRVICAKENTVLLLPESHQVVQTAEMCQKLKTTVSINTIIFRSFFFFFLITGLVMARYSRYSFEILADANKKELLFLSIPNDLN